MATFTIEGLTEKMLNFHRVFYPDLLSKYYESRKLSSIFPTTIGISDKIVFTGLQVGEVAQSYQKTFTPKGELGIIPEEYTLRHLKVNKEIEPKELIGTYLSSYLKSDITEENEVLIRFYADMMLRAAEDIDIACINGTYVPITAGQPNAAINMIDGLKTLVNRFITEGKITPFDSDTITEENAAKVLNKLWRQVPARYQNNPRLRCYIGDGVWNKYRENFDHEYGILNVNNTHPEIIHNTNCRIVVVPYLGNSDMVLFTMDGNIRLLANNPSDAMRFRAQAIDHTIHYIQEWSAGIGIPFVGKVGGSAEDQMVWCNEFDQPETPPAPPAPPSD
jgi:hypothetical protein